MLVDSLQLIKGSLLVPGVVLELVVASLVVEFSLVDGAA